MLADKKLVVEATLRSKETGIVAFLLYPYGNCHSQFLGLDPRLAAELKGALGYLLQLLVQPHSLANGVDRGVLDNLIAHPVFQETEPGHPDFLLADIWMPVFHGLEYVVSRKPEALRAAVDQTVALAEVVCNYDRSDEEYDDRWHILQEDLIAEFTALETNLVDRLGLDALLSRAESIRTRATEAIETASKAEPAKRT